MEGRGTAWAEWRFFMRHLSQKAKCVRYTLRDLLRAGPSTIDGRAIRCQTGTSPTAGEGSRTLNNQLGRLVL